MKKIIKDNQMNTDLMFSSKKPDWETPQAFFDDLDKEFHFTLDAAASDRNTKCERYYTEQDNALDKEWGESTYCNPPYGRG